MPIKIVFMGTPDFAVASLDAICKSNINVAGVITAPDKPAGRGKKINQSAVKQYADANNIKTLQPTNLKDPEFQKELRELDADLFVVVAFRMLPETVWSMPPKGTINLHASLLPQYRGAAPINWAVINGEKESGVTTFFIQHEIDTGGIIDQEKVSISTSDTAGTLHDKLMSTGAHLLVKTVKQIEEGAVDAIPQDKINSETPLKEAPKIFKEDCHINWNQSVQKVFNFIRGLSPYPAAFTEFSNQSDKQLSFKIFEAEIIEEDIKDQIPGTIDFSEKGTIKISCTDGKLKIITLQQAGKKRMDTTSFLLGFKNTENFNLAN